MTRLVRLSDANGTYQFVAAVSGAHPDDLDYLGRHPRQMDRLRAVILGEFEGDPRLSCATHVIAYRGWEEHVHRIALLHVDEPFPVHEEVTA